MAFDPSTDPLGVGLKQQARARKQAFQLENPGVPTGIPGVGDDFDAFLEAIGGSGPPGASVRLAGASGPSYSSQIAGTSMQPSGAAGVRPSIAALRSGGIDGSSPFQSSHDRAMQQLDADNALEASRQGTYEYQRNAGIDRAAQARTNRAADEEQASTNNLFELGSGRAAARARAIGQITDEQKMGDARLGSDIYFDPKVARQRADELYQRMQELRTRYADPAIIKGQTEIAAAATRGQAGVDREGVRGGYGIQEQTLRNQGNQSVADTRARASVGAATAGAGGDPSKYVQPRTAQPAPLGLDDLTGGRGPTPQATTKEMSRDELAQFANDNGMQTGDALNLARSLGYTVR